MTQRKNCSARAWTDDEVSVARRLVNRRLTLREATEILTDRSERAIQLMAQKLRRQSEPDEKPPEMEPELAGQLSARKDAEMGSASLLKAVLNFYENRRKRLSLPLEVPSLPDGSPDYESALAAYGRREVGVGLSPEQVRHRTRLQSLLERERVRRETEERKAAERAQKCAEREEMRDRAARARHAARRAKGLAKLQRDREAKDAEDFLALRPPLEARILAGEVVQARVVGARKLYQETIDLYEECSQKVVLNAPQSEYLELIRQKRVRQQHAARYRQRHPDRAAEANRSYMRKNPEVSRNASKRYRKNHREEFLQQLKDYRRRNPEKIREIRARPHKREHPADCAGCGKSILVSQHTLDNAPGMGVFCGKRCRFQHPEYRVEKTSDCEHCGQSFSQRVLPWREPSPVCSRKCRSRRSAAQRKLRAELRSLDGLSPPESCDAEGLSSSCCEPETDLRDLSETGRESTLELSA